MEKQAKQTVRGVPVPETEDAQKLAATRLADAEALAVERHQRINMVWEYTQAYMAVLVITSVLLTSIFVAVKTEVVEIRIAALVFMYGLANLIAGFYFGRTNHTRPTGGDR